jgi:methanogenic corrinoid protein MtbC1
VAGLVDPADAARAAVAGSVDVLAGAVADCAARGWSIGQVIDELVAPAQRLVGLGWQEGSLSVADEHRATASWERVLARALPRPETGQAATRPTGHGPVRLAAACVETDWHAVASRLVALRLAAVGLEVVWLGGSVPGRHLVAWLSTHDVDGVVLTCSRPTALLGAARSVAAVQLTGLPVALGGAAVTAARAEWLGADGGGSEGAAAYAIVEAVVARRPGRRRRRADGVSNRLADLAAAEAAPGPPGPVAEVVASELAHAGVDASRVGPLAAQVADDLVATVGAAIFLGDGTVVAELVAWLAAVVPAAGSDRAGVRRVLTAAAGALAAGSAVVRDAVDAELGSDDR